MNYSLTPLRDIDIYCVLPYLDVKDIHYIICTTRNVPHEFTKRLLQLKYSVYRNIKYFNPSELSNIKYYLHVDDNTNKEYETKTKEDLITHEHVIEVETSILKTDVNNVPCLFLKYKDQRCKHIIYNRRIKIIHDNIAIYCLHNDDCTDDSKD